VKTHGVNIAFGQTLCERMRPWGDAPGYGERWPSAKGAMFQLFRVTVEIVVSVFREVHNADIDREVN